MPVVPFAAQRAHRQGPDLSQVDPTFLMMAAAELHEAGRLVEPLEERSDHLSIPPKDVA